MSNLMLQRLLLLAALGAVLGGCAAAPATSSHPANSLYRCDRNGDMEQREAC